MKNKTLLSNACSQSEGDFPLLWAESVDGLRPAPKLASEQPSVQQDHLGSSQDSVSRT